MIVLMLVGTTIKVIDPKNGDFDYVGLNVSYSGSKTIDKGNLTFYINASNAKYNYFINSSPVQNNNLYVNGIIIGYLGQNYPVLNKSCTLKDFIDKLVLSPNVNITFFRQFSLNEKNRHNAFHWNKTLSIYNRFNRSLTFKNVAPGFYFLTISPLKISSQHRVVLSCSDTTQIFRLTL